MTGAELKTALGKLRLPLTARLTCRLLGVSGRQIQRYCAGQNPVPRSVAILVYLLLDLEGGGIPPAVAAARCPWAVNSQYGTEKI